MERTICVRMHRKAGELYTESFSSKRKGWKNPFFLEKEKRRDVEIERVYEVEE